VLPYRPKADPQVVGVITHTPVAGKLVPSQPIAGYGLYVTLHGTIRGNLLPIWNNIDKEISAVLQDMAFWYLANRIATNEKKYKKWKM
jgi:hypothetical protein